MPFEYEPHLHEPKASYEETTMFHLCCIGTIAAAFVFAPSEPYSRPIYTNSEWLLYRPLKVITSPETNGIHLRAIADLKYPDTALCKSLTGYCK